MVTPDPYIPSSNFHGDQSGLVRAFMRDRSLFPVCLQVHMHTCGDNPSCHFLDARCLMF